MIILHSFTRMA